MTALISWPTLRSPLVVAPMAGGPTTPALVAAVCAAGGTGFLPSGYLTAAQLEHNISVLRDDLTARGLPQASFGVNLFVPTQADRGRDEAAVEAYRRTLGDAAGAARWDDDDHFGDKVRLLLEVDRVPMVSFTFGCPSADVVEKFHAVGTSVGITVTDESEAAAAVAVGADVLVVQGFDAGGHRGTHSVEAVPNRLDALALLPLVTSFGLPVVAAGGVATSGDVARLLAAGAVAVQCGTAFLRCPEAGTSAVHRELLAHATGTAVTRAFSGRPARGLRNGFMDRFDGQAPSVYPQVDQATKPLRAAAAAAGDVDGISAWAGAAWSAARAVPVAEVVADLCGGL